MRIHLSIPSILQVEEELKEGINKQFSHKIQVDTSPNDSQEFLYNNSAVVFDQLSPPPENSGNIQPQPITIIQQPGSISYDPMTPPASIEQHSPNSSTLVNPIEIATTVFQQPCITSSYMDLPAATGQHIEHVYENTLSPTIQSNEQTVNLSYAQPAIENFPVITTSEVVSSTGWINTSGTENSNSSSSFSSSPSSPSAQLSPSPPHSPNSSNASSGGRSPQLFISESKSASPSIPSAQVSPTSDIEPIFENTTNSDTKRFLNQAKSPILISKKSNSGSNTLKLSKDGDAGSGQKVVIQLQNHQLQQLKNQLSLFVVSNATSNSNSTLTSSSTQSSLMDFSPGSSNIAGNGIAETATTSLPSSTTDIVKNKNTKLLTVLKPVSNGTSFNSFHPNYAKNNMYLKVEDGIQDEITPNSPPLCRPIALPLNVQVKQEVPKPVTFQKTQFRAIKKGPSQSSNSQINFPLPSKQIQSSSMSTASPSMMHRLGKRPSSFNHSLLSLPTPNKSQKRDNNINTSIVINNASSSNIVAMNDAYIINTISGPTTTGGSTFVTTSPNTFNDLKQQPVGDCLQLIKTENYQKSIMLSSYSSTNTANNLPVSIQSKNSNPQLVVLRSSLSPRVMRKVIGISPPRGTAGINSTLIPSAGGTIQTSNIMTDNLVCMM